MRATPGAVQEVAAALTGRHLNADGSCSETHYPEAMDLVKFLEGRGYEVRRIGSELGTQAGTRLRVNMLYHNSECDKLDDFDAITGLIRDVEREAGMNGWNLLVDQLGNDPDGRDTLNEALWVIEAIWPYVTPSLMRDELEQRVSRIRAEAIRRIRQGME